MWQILVALHAVLMAAEPATVSPLLEIGSPSPALVTMTYLRGDAIEKFSPGTIYVIEFSGTTCVPCIQAIPHINELQRTHSDVVFLSVYCEPETGVRNFLAERGGEIEIRVAVDSTGKQRETWSEAACQEGIPHIFIVGKNGNIAWIGHPTSMAVPLAEIIAGRFDPRVDVLRLKVEQGAVIKARRQADRERQAYDEYNRINQAIIARQYITALVDTETALVTFQDCPQACELLLNAKSFLLIQFPDRHQASMDNAISLAIEARSQGQPLRLLNLASNMLNAVEVVKPEDRNQQIVDLALALLSEPGPEGTTTLTHELTAKAYHLRGDHRRAVDAIRAAMVSAKSDVERLQDLESQLETYRQGTIE